MTEYLEEKRRLDERRIEEETAARKEQNEIKKEEMTLRREELEIQRQKMELDAANTQRQWEFLMNKKFGSGGWSRFELTKSYCFDDVFRTIYCNKTFGFESVQER